MPSLPKKADTFLGFVNTVRLRCAVSITSVPVGRVVRVAGEDLDAAPGTPNEPLAGRLAVFVALGKRTLPPGTLLDDGRVFGIGTPFGLGIVCGHGRSLQRPTGSRVPTTRALSRPRGTGLSLPYCMNHMVLVFTIMASHLV